jgi:hypothetical protein
MRYSLRVQSTLQSGVMVPKLSSGGDTLFELFQSVARATRAGSVQTKTFSSLTVPG